jgi:hypothetical protein
MSYSGAAITRKIKPIKTAFSKADFIIIGFDSK